jgi:HEPN domain-containing protein
MSQRDGRDHARVLLDRAAGDETLVRRVLDDHEIPDAILGFHAQQAVEKSIKAVLAAYGIAFAKTHDLDYLTGLIEANRIDAPAALARVDELTPWAVEFRYETESEPPLDRPAALHLVEELRIWAVETVDPTRRGDSVG